jgi:hypothetical protein
MQMEFRAIAGNYARGFLPAMLQRVKTEICEVRRFRVPEDAEYTTLVVEVIVENFDAAAHFVSEKDWSLTPAKIWNARQNIQAAMNAP